ncbi:egl nine homolog 1 [Cydia splendana]|uniref:egl nine homolog 1 n=1 Tax=Cydia splendana TaxID=1100963 RepID=UPI00300D2032
MNQESVLACCAVCNQRTVRRCSRCLSIYYCNTDHQRQDWKRHKPECVPRTPKQGPRNEKIGGVSTSTAEAVRIGEVKDDATHGGASCGPQGVSTPDGSATSDTRRSKSSKKKNAIKEGSVSVSKQNAVGTSGVNSGAVPKNQSVISSVLCASKDKDKVNSAITYEGSSEQEILSESAQQLSAVEFSTASTTVKTPKSEPNMLAVAGYSGEQAPMKEYPEGTVRNSSAPFGQPQNSFYMDPSDQWYNICQQVIRDMTQFGVCVLDNFLGQERGHLVRNEVLKMYRSGIFQAGELVANPGSTDAHTVRSDRITWIDGKEPHCFYIKQLINQVDNIILRANKMPNNGKLGDYTINGRTRAMVACYPGSGTHYVKHVDNPNKDGRCITAIYYLNLNWDKERCGGLLRVFPEGLDEVANIKPLFDRMVFFWSDRRNPHEVQPAYETRYAITLWYFDAKERTEALKRHRQNREPKTSQ